MVDVKIEFSSFKVFVVLLFIYPKKTKSIDFKATPNVMLLLVDNLGFSDIRIFGNGSVKTPNIDRLAEDGVRFTRWYSQSSSASTRASILTGHLPIKTGILKSRYLPYKSMPSLASTGGLQPDQITLAEVLRSKGYQTAFVGHWGMGIGQNNAFLPIHQGFTHWYGVPTLHNKYCIARSSNLSNETNKLFEAQGDVEDVPTRYIFIVVLFTVVLGGLTVLWVFKKIDMMMFVGLAVSELILLYLIYFSFDLMTFVHSRNCVLYRDTKIIEQPFIVNNMTLKFTKETIQLLNNFSSKKSPFFIMNSYLKLHEPWYVSNAFSNCSENNLFLCALLELDWSIGKIIGTLDSLGKANDTLVILTSSGGPCNDADGDCNREYGQLVSVENKSAQLKGGGNNVWEGDIRVPTIMRWQQKIQPGQIINVTTSCMDIMPTLMDLTNQSSTLLESDGKSLIPFLINSSEVSQHKLLFHYTDVFKPSGVTYGKYKLVFVTEDGVTLFHDPPLIFNTEADPGETLPVSQSDLPQNILSQVLLEVEEHLSNRTDKGTSQFDKSFVPWLFPCANVPSCSQVNSKDDFNELLNKT